MAVFEQELLLKKQSLKNEIINRIKKGNFERGLYHLLDITGDLSIEERRDIAVFWFKTNKKELVNYYLFDLLTNNRESIKRTDHFSIKKFLFF